VKASSTPVQAVFVLWNDHPAEIESIWLKRVGPNRWEVLTVPFFAYNLSRGDIVDCHPDEDGIGRFVGNVLMKSGHRTVRVAFWAPLGVKHPAARSLVKEVRKAKWTHETFGPRLIAIDCPSDADYEKLQALLRKVPKTAKMKWEDGDPQEARLGVGGADVERRRRKVKTRVKQTRR
jgi:hypothetical protein